MTTRRRADDTQATQEGLDALAGTHVRARTRRDRAHEDALAGAEAAERRPAGAEPDLGTPMSDRQLDQRDRQQSAKRKKPGPKPPETPPAAPVAPPPTAPPPTDPE
jgi:hypothetical protein